jgi:hypothetical protein
MRPGMQCLLELLRGKTSDRPLVEKECEAALALAEEEHILPWTAACLRLQPASLTPRIQIRIEQIERDAALAAFYWNSELKSVLRAFDQSSLPVVLLKGPCLAERLYGSAALRASRDLDLLVSKANLTRAESVLTSIGFIPAPYPDDYHRAWHRQTTTVELHHNVENPLAFNFEVETAILAAEPAIFQGQPALHLAPEDELLFLCLHAARHRFERLSLVLDLQFAFERLSRNLTDPPRPQTAELNNLLTLGLAMMRRLQPGTTIAFQSHASSKQIAHLDRLADRLWHRLLTESAEPLDWHAVHAFYLEIEPAGWPRLHHRYRHLKILTSRVIGPDYAFAARFGLHKTWQVWTLRPLRLLSELMRR